MLVYRSDTDKRQGFEVWHDVVRQATQLTRECRQDDAIGFLIALGEAESAIVDRICAREETAQPVARLLRAASTLAARVVLAVTHGDCPAVERHLHALQRAVAAIPLEAVPGTLQMSVSEGYAYYALHPEAYAQAAQRFISERRPSHVQVLGIRSIGASLSAVVAAAIGALGVAADSWTVRPRGHPFDRRLTLRDDLARELIAGPRDQMFAVVDEGPGLSGSSFAAVVSALTDRGVDPQHIVLFPSWDPDGAAFKSDRARLIWHGQRRYCSVAAAAPTALAVPFRWRELLYNSEDDWPASHPQHERVKWLAADAVSIADSVADGGYQEVIRFAGLGHYGVARHERAEALAAEGLGAPPTGLRNGYLTVPFVAGVPCNPTDVCPELLDTIASHVATLARLFPRWRRPDLDATQAMIETNVRLGLGDTWVHAVTFPRDERDAIESAPAVAIDGRMLAHEWIRTSDGFVKVDALDHHADHFFPGTQDVAWDLVSASAEFDLDHSAREYLINAYVRASRDRDIRARLAFYERAYLAFRLGYTTMSAEALAGTPEAARFERRRRRYRDRLIAALRHREPVPSARESSGSSSTSR